MTPESRPDPFAAFLAELPLHPHGRIVRLPDGRRAWVHPDYDDWLEAWSTQSKQERDKILRSNGLR